MDRDLWVRVWAGFVWVWVGVGVGLGRVCVGDGLGREVCRGLGRVYGTKGMGIL